MFFAVFVLYIGVETKNDWGRLLPLVGLFAFILVGYALSKHRRHVNWITVATGLATQITIGLLTIRWPVGRSVIRAIGELAEKFFSFAYIGAEVTYGHELIDVYAVFAFKVSGSARASYSISRPRPRTGAGGPQRRRRTTVPKESDKRVLPQYNLCPSSPTLGQYDPDIACWVIFSYRENN